MILILWRIDLFVLILKMKNKIQILIVSMVCLFWFVWVSNATYSLTWDDLKQLNSYKITISEASNYGVRSYYSQLSKWYDILKSNERLWAISKDLRDFAYSLLDSRRKSAKQQSVSVKSKFFDEYGDEISDDIEFLEDKCTWWYNTIDSISFANDFPTALTIAVWYRESTCAYYLPWNWDWPFQIVSKDYGTGEITEELFKQAIQDFIDFSKRKIDRYNDRSDDEYSKINISYTGFDYTWVVNYLALYNWWIRTWWIVEPNAPEYVFDWYGEEYSSAKKYWVFSMFLKMLEWELDNM